MLLKFVIDGSRFKVETGETGGFTVKSAFGALEVGYDDRPPEEALKEALAKAPGAPLIIDETVYAARKRKIDSFCGDMFVVNAREENKTLETALEIVKYFRGREVSRRGEVVAVGGGITQEVAGFAAAIYKRGVRLRLFPSTLLAMADSCVGGKTSLNFDGAKNQLGLFYPPKNVTICPAFLKTLPARQIYGGLGEIFKSCVIGGEEALSAFETATANGMPPPDELTRLSRISLLIKKAVTERDEFDFSERAALNLGHTIGHAVEVLSNYKMPHGSAVAIGVCAACEISADRGLLAAEDKKRIISAGRAVISREAKAALKRLDVSRLGEVARKDKKAEGGAVKFVALKGAGRVAFIDFPLNEVFFGLASDALKAAADY